MVFHHIIVCYNYRDNTFYNRRLAGVSAILVECIMSIWQASESVVSVL